jgi:RHS repeat-associated protein
MRIVRRGTRFRTSVLLFLLSTFMACGPEDDAAAGAVEALVDLVPSGTIVPSTPVGALPVSISVSNNGAAVGTISLWTPEGRAGIAPSLALSYSSAAGEGLVGVGWSLSGLGSISRCPPSGARFVSGVRHDNIRFDATDQYCLNGELLTKTPARAYNPSDAVAAFHPEGDPDVLVEAYGDDLGHPDYFTVWSTGGRLTTFRPTIYGRRVSTATEDGTLVQDPADSTLEWGPHQVEDPSGNTMSITWRTLSWPDGVEAVPDQILYTAGAHADGRVTVPANRVTFSYETPPLPTASFVNGLRLYRWSRLHRIEVFGRDENDVEGLVREYRLQYRNDASITHRSLLQSVTACDRSGVCLPSTTFAYEAGSEAVRVDTLGIVDSRVSIGDLDGDGRDDIVSQSNGAPSESWVVWPGTSSGPSGFATSILANTSVLDPVTSISNPVFADLDGDLYADLFQGSIGLGWDYRAYRPTDSVPFVGFQSMLGTESTTGWGSACIPNTARPTSTCAAGACVLVAGRGVCADPARCYYSCTSSGTCGALLPADDGGAACLPQCNFGAAPCPEGSACMPQDFFYADYEHGEVLTLTEPVCAPNPFLTAGALPLYIVDTDSDGVLEANVLQGNSIHRYKRDMSSPNGLLDVFDVRATVLSEEDGGAPHRILDLDGDGLTDLVGGGGLAPDETWLPFKRVSIDGGGSSTLNVVPRGNQQVFIDVNGDGLPDIVNFDMPASYGYSVGIRLNTGRCVEQPPAPCVLGFQAPYDAFDSRSFVVDTDRYKVTADQYLTGVNDDNPDGFVRRVFRWWLTTPRLFPVDYDVDGDTDLIVLGDDPCLLRSDGRFFAREPLPFSLLDPVYQDPDTVIRNGGYADKPAFWGLFTVNVISDLRLPGAQHRPLPFHMLDVDGNGRTDFLFPACGLAPGEPTCRGRYAMARTQGSVPDVLTTVIDGMGETTKIVYRDLSQRSTLDAPLTHDCSSLVAADSGMLEQGSVVCGERRGLVVDSLTRSAGTVVHATNYGWGNKIVDPGWGSLGFDVTRTRDVSSGTTTTATFSPHQLVTGWTDSVRRGRTYWGLGTATTVTSETKTSDGVLRRTVTSTVGDVYPQMISAAVPLRTTKFKTIQVTTEESVFAPTTVVPPAPPPPPVTVTSRIVTYGYGTADAACALGALGGWSTGNPSWLPVGAPITVPTRVTTDVYTESYPGSPSTTALSRSTVSVGGTAGAVPGQLLVQTVCEVDGIFGTTPQIVRRSSFEYDVWGRLTATTREPTHSDYQYLRTEFTPESDGLVSKIVQRTAGTCWGTRTQVIGYGPDRQYPTTFTNDLGQVRYVGMHPSLGVVAMTLDEGGVQTTMRYDGFGRPAAVIGVTAVYFTYAPEYVGGESLLRQTAIAATGASSQRLFNAFGQLRVERTRRADGRWAEAVTTLDPAGRPSRIGRPQYVGTTADQWAATYDELDRLRSYGPLGDASPRQFYSDASLTAGVLNVAGAGRWEYAADREHREQAVRRDGLGRIVEVSQGGLATAQFRYSASGLLIGTTDANGRTSASTYDALGFRLRSDDVGSGTTTWEYDPFGEITVERRWGYVGAPGAALPASPVQVRSFAYDTLGRKRAEYDGAHTCGTGGTTRATWGYDTAPNGVGRLATMATTDGRTSYSVTYTSRGQLASMIQTVDGANFLVNVVYDGYGRESSTVYPSVGGVVRYAVNREYSTFNGALKRIYDSTGKTLWMLNDEDGEGRTTKETLGNNITVNSTFWANTGELKTQWARASGATTNTFDFAYTYDREGNLRARVDAPSNRTETIYYDSLARLNSWRTWPTSGGESLGRLTNYTYDPVGNLQSSSLQLGTGVPVTSTYSYADARFPYATTGIGTAAYAYDNLGRRKDSPTASIVFERHDLPSTITGAVSTSYLYDANGARVRKTSSAGYTMYVGKAFELRASGATLTGVHYVPLPNGHFYQHEISATTGVATRKWMIGDGRGSLVGVTDEAGVLRERLYLDPWGARVDSTGAPASPVRTLGVDVGFTGHEHDEVYGLINMNGRIFDPTMRRFLTQDPIISTFNTQSASPYSYVQNRPYAFVDPSGFELTALDFSVDVQMDEEVVTANHVHKFGAVAHGSPASASRGAASDGWTGGPAERYMNMPDRSGTPVAAGTLGGDRPLQLRSPSGDPRDTPIGGARPFGGIGWRQTGLELNAIADDAQNSDGIRAWAVLFAVVESPLFWIDTLATGGANDVVEYTQAGAQYAARATMAHDASQAAGDIGMSALYGVNAAILVGSVVAPVGEGVVAAEAEMNVVYRSLNAAGEVQYVGITNSLARRAAEHLAGRGIQIEKLMGGLARTDARAVEQALIEIHGLGRTGGTLLNRINGIAPSNPAYAAQVQRGYELLQSIGY